MALRFQTDLFNPRIKTEEIKIKKSTSNTTTTTSPEITTSTSSASSTHSATSDLIKPSSSSTTTTAKKSKITSLFSKSSKPEPTPEDAAKTKEMVMKYRNMTSEEADAYLAEKKNGDGLNTERGLRAFGMAVAPVRL